MQMLQAQLSEPVIGQISRQIGATEQQTATASNGIFTALLGGLAQNTSNKDGLSSLVAALDRDHDGSALDDLAGFVGGMLSGSIAGRNANGNGILGHILGDRQASVAQNIGEKTGLSSDQVAKLMPILAPIAMSLLARMLKKSPQEATAPTPGTGGMGELARILMGSAQHAQKGDFGDLLSGVLGGLPGQGGSQPANSGGSIFANILRRVFKS